MDGTTTIRVPITILDEARKPEFSQVIAELLRKAVKGEIELAEAKIPTERCHLYLTPALMVQSKVLASELGIGRSELVLNLWKRYTDGKIALDQPSAPTSE